MRLNVWLFGGSEFYPSGGMNDLMGRYPSIESATAAAVEAERQGRVEWWQIVRCHSLYARDHPNSLRVVIARLNDAV